MSLKRSIRHPIDSFGSPFKSLYTHIRETTKQGKILVSPRFILGILHFSLLYNSGKVQVLESDKSILLFGRAVLP